MWQGCLPGDPDPSALVPMTDRAHPYPGVPSHLECAEDSSGKADQTQTPRPRLLANSGDLEQGPELHFNE